MRWYGTQTAPTQVVARRHLAWLVCVQAQGYARYRKESWEYSSKALAVLEAYRKAFPKLFSRINAMGNNVDEYYENDLFDANDAPDHGAWRARANDAGRRSLRAELTHHRARASGCTPRQTCKR